MNVSKVMLMLTVIFFSIMTNAIELRALAEYTHLKSPIYHAALYSDKNVTSVEQWYDQNQIRQMEFRFIQNRISVRTFSRSLLERIMANNKDSVVMSYQSQIQQLLQAVRQPFTTGDRILILSRPGEEVLVLINQVKVLSFAEPETFDLIVNAWIGEKLRGQSFYKDLMAGVNSNQLQSFNELSMGANRLNWAKSIAQNLQDSVAKKAEVTQEAKGSKEQRAQEQKSAAQNVAKKSVSSTSSNSKNQTARKVEAEAQKQSAQTLKATKPKASKTTDNRDTATKPVESASIRSSKKSSTSAVKQKPPTVKAEPKEALNPLLKELRDDYLIDLADSIQSKANPRPPRTLRKVTKEDVEVKVTVTKDGAVQNVRFVSEDIKEDLQLVIAESISRLKTIPAAPELLKEESYTVDVSFNFAKCKKTGSAWLCF